MKNLLVPFNKSTSTDMEVALTPYTALAKVFTSIVIIIYGEYNIQKSLCQAKKKGGL
jgi:hypothetical protein